MARPRGWLLFVIALLLGALALSVYALDRARDDGETEMMKTDGSPTTTEDRSDEPPSSAAAVLAWVDALEQGDHERAVELTAPASQEWMREVDDPDALLIELSEGYGAWGASKDRKTQTTSIEGSGTSEVEIVVLSGTVSQEGSTSERVVAIPVRILGKDFRVEPFDLADTETRIEFVAPEIGPDGALPLPVGDPVEVVVPSATQVTFRLDSDAPISLTPDARGRARFDSNGSILPGEHLVLVVSVGPEHVTAAALRFTVR
jgi:hypothetical protein